MTPHFRTWSTRDRLPSGEAIAFGIRELPQPGTLPTGEAPGAGAAYVVGISRRQSHGRWRRPRSTARRRSRIARPLPRIFGPMDNWDAGLRLEPEGRRLCYGIFDQRSLGVAATIATEKEMRSRGFPVTMPWLEATAHLTAVGWLSFVPAAVRDRRWWFRIRPTVSVGRRIGRGRGWGRGRERSSPQAAEPVPASRRAVDSPDRLRRITVASISRPTTRPAVERGFVITSRAAAIRASWLTPSGPWCLRPPTGGFKLPIRIALRPESSSASDGSSPGHALSGPETLRRRVGCGRGLRRPVGEITAYRGRT